MDRATQERYHKAFTQQLFRLFKLSEMHDPRNQAVAHTANEAARELNNLGATAGGTLSAFFDDRDVFLNGQPLRASRRVYDQATQLGARLTRMGANELLLQTPINVQDLQRLMARRAQGTSLIGIEEQVSPRVWLRHKEATPLMNLAEDIGPQELVARSCAAALVVVDRFYEGLRAGDYAAVRYVKRIARNLVLLNERYPTLLLSFAGSTPDRGDVPTFAVKGAILTMITLRQLTRDLRNLTDVALAALLYSSGIVRACGLMKQAETHSLVALPQLPPQALERLPESSAAMMTLFGAMGEASLTRSVYLYEGQLLEHRLRRDLPAPPTLEALTLATTRRFLTLLSQASQLRSLPGRASRERSVVDEAIALLEEEATTPLEHKVRRLFLSGVGLYRRATPVVLTSGWQGVVVANHERPSCFSRPIVRLLKNPQGHPLLTPRDIDLSLPTRDAAPLGCVAGLADTNDPILSRAREDLRQRTRRPTRAPAPTPSEASDAQERRLAELESRSQIRKAPIERPAQRPSIFEAQDHEPAPHTPGPPAAQSLPGDHLAKPVARAGPAQLAWGDEDTSHSLPSDNIQMLNIADIAHMVPDELANQEYSPPQPEHPSSLEWGRHEDTSRTQTSAPSSLDHETWNKLLDEVGPQDDEDTAVQSGVASDSIFILSGSFDPGEVIDDEIEMTSLLPPEIVEAFMYRDRQEHDARSEASELSPPPRPPEED